MGARQVIAAASIAAGFLVSSGTAFALTEADRALYAAAVKYCRNNPDRLVLNDEKKIFCFDGKVTEESDVSSLKALDYEGLFVVRSSGGSAIAAARIATLLEAMRATVVIYDYCLSACASFFFIAPARTYVAKESIVAWHYGGWRGWSACRKDDFGYVSLDGLWHATRDLCETASKPFRELQSTVRPFFSRRVVDSRRYNFLKAPPQSPRTSAILVQKLNDAGTFPEIMWMWHPRYLRSALRTEVYYERYPESQDEVDALTRRFLDKDARSGTVLHDP